MSHQVVALVAWTLRRSLAGIVALLLGIALFELVQPVAIASFGDLDRITPLLGIVPPSFWALLNVTPEFVQGAGLAGFLALGFTHPIYHVLVSTTVIWFVARGLAGEMERGTLQLALSRSLSRQQVFLSRVIGTLIVIALVTLAGPIGMTIGISISDPDGGAPGRHLLTVMVPTALLAWAIGGIATAIAARVNTMGRAVGVAIGVVVLSYVVDYFATIWSALRPLEPASFYSYYEPTSALASGSLDVADLAVLAAIGFAGMLIGAVIFERRDLPV